MSSIRTMLRVLTLCLPLLQLSMAVGCKPFDVNVSTPQPIKVNLSMDVHVYQHGKPDTKKAVEQAQYRNAMDSRRNRMAEVQELKNNRLVGENRQGLLDIRSRPAGEYGDYVSTTVEAENRDRETLMKQEAEEKNQTLAQVRAEQWQHWQRKSFPGEWIEVQTDSGYQWKQKEAAN